MPLSRKKRGLMEIDDAVHALHMAAGRTICPTCGEDLTFVDIVNKDAMQKTP